jgi:hypothetical protein
MKQIAIVTTSAIGIAAAALAGCASVPPPTEQMAVSRAALDQAQSAGAVEHAPLEYNSARRKLDLAVLAFREKDYARARQLAEQAEADAVLAQSKATATRSEQAVARVREDIRVLQDELNRTQGGGK